MATTAVQIYNMALARVGHTDRVADPAEGSVASDLCNTFFEQSRDFVLEDYPWRFAKRQLALALLADTPPTKWTYQYALPADCLRIRMLNNPLARVTLYKDRIPFERATDGSQALIYTDLEDAELIYTCRVSDLTKWDPSAVSALVYHLASELAVPLKGAQGLQIAQAMLNGYQMAVRQAAAKSLNEGFDTPVDSEFITSRNA